MLNKIQFLTVLTVTLCCGCLSFGSWNDEWPKDPVLVANTNNVYRLSEDTVLKVKVQGPDGRWVDSEYRVLVPADWYLVDGGALGAQ